MTTRQIFVACALAGTLALSCHDETTVVVVSVSANPNVPPISRIRVILSIRQASDVRLFPEVATVEPISFPATLALVLPAQHTEALDIALEGLDTAEAIVANGAADVVIKVGGRVDVSVLLAAGVSLCGNRSIDPGEECDDGGRVSGDGCNYVCMKEVGPVDGGADASPTGGSGGISNGGGAGESAIGGGSGGSSGGGSGGSASGGGSGGNVGGAGSGGTVGKGGAGGATVSMFAPVAAILGMNCGTGTCHTGIDHVDLRNTAGLYSRIVGVMPSGRSVRALCGSTLTLVVPGNTADSLISSAIQATFVANVCTTMRQPEGCPGMRPCLTTQQIATIDSWIAAGAPM